MAQRRSRTGGRRRPPTGSQDHLHHHAARGLRLLQEGRGGAYVSDGAIRPRWPAGPTTPVAAISARATHSQNMVIENVRQLRHDADDSCRSGRLTKRQHTYDYREGRLPAGQAVRSDGQCGLGEPRHRVSHQSSGVTKGERKERTMASRPPISGMPLDINDLDTSRTWRTSSTLRGAVNHLQKCSACGLLRYPPTTACPWCASQNRGGWRSKAGRRLPHTEVHHAIQPAARRIRPISSCWSTSIRRTDKPAAKGACVVGNPRRRRHAGFQRRGAPRRHRQCVFVWSLPTSQLGLPSNGISSTSGAPSLLQPQLSADNDSRNGTGSYGLPSLG